ncbi:uncharacterized protein A4U43_C02F9070 [Asparagus officinalis]|uniref:MAT1 centre domain-containing protein n=1 Tax=Asparagus officinalis TaxID=4686 RepID=A0A5P1FHW5_ASPOF|nr:uncharacterized protein A4U43_C02F9070 [Asparagus officinalis]
MVVSSTASSFSKEMSIRRKISSIFNKREEDFPSLREYNDYLEEVEDMTFNLIEGIDVAAIEAKIEKYRKENAEQIANAEARKAEELAAALKASKGPLHTESTDTGAAQTSQGATGGVTVQGQYAPSVVPGSVLAAARPTPPLAQLGGRIASSFRRICS